MSLLSKAEVQFLSGQKIVSKSYEYKLKLIITKKIAILIDKELPLINSIVPNIDLTKFSKNQSIRQSSSVLTIISKNRTTPSRANLPTNPPNLKNSISRYHDKLYNCPDFIHQHRRVRSVVRISRRSSEPQVMGSKPTGPVNHMGSNNSTLYRRLDKRRYIIAR